MRTLATAGLVPYDNLMLCKPGEAVPRVESGATWQAGRGGTRPAGTVLSVTVPAAGDEQQARSTAAAVTGRRGVTSGKLASVVADRIVSDVVSQGWPVGQVLGSERALLARYGVSRAVFREAVRLVEHQQVARMRRGPGGGLVVVEPSVGSIIDAVLVYLSRIDARLDDVFDARMILEEMVAGLAPSRLDDSHRAELQALVERERHGEVLYHREMHALLAAATGNAALALFVDILNRVSKLYVDDTERAVAEVREASAHAHVRIAEAVMDGDGALARRRMHRHLEAEADWLRGLPASRQVLDPRRVSLTGGSDKRAEVVARGVFTEVVSDGWPVGMLVGSEAELIARYDVSRAVLREAVRLLEHHDIAVMRRGPGGGLFVSEPGLEAVTDAVALLLDRRGMDAAGLGEVRSGVELAIVDRVIAGLDDDGTTRLAEALEAERSAPDQHFLDVVGHDLHAVLAQLTGNPVLELVTLVLIRLSRFHQLTPAGHRPEAIVEEVARVHGRIVEAVVGGDRDLARHRMRRHLGAIAPYFG